MEGRDASTFHGRPEPPAAGPATAVEGALSATREPTATREPQAPQESPSATTPVTIDPPATPDKRGVVELVVGFSLALAGMAVFALVAGGLYDQEAVALDQLGGPFLHSVSTPALDAVMNAITSLGSGPVLAPLTALAVAALLLRGHRARALFVLVAIGGSVALNGTLKVFIQRPRPVLPWAHVLPDYSFPSGHTMNALVLYLALALIVWATRGRRAGSIAVGLALGLAVAIGFSRIYLGYHYLSDVVGGLAAGLAWLFVVAVGFEAIPRAYAWRVAAGRRLRHPA